MQEQARSSSTQAPAAAPREEGSVESGPPDADEHAPIGFRSRGRARRRARFLRRARELAYRDLGGLVFSLHRFGQRNDPLVLAKLTTLGRIDTELRALEDSLEEPQPVSVLREAGIAACPRCAAIHSSEDGFCPNCGLPVDRHVDLPAGFQAPAPAAAASGAAPSAAIAGTPAPPQPGPPTPAQPSAPAAAQPSAPGSAQPSAPVPAEPAVGRAPMPPVSAPTVEQDGPTEIIRPQPPPS